MIYNAAKRIFDIAASGLGLLVLLPFAIPVFIALKLTGEGKIFFGQTRIGYRNQPFKILKLATMLEDSLNMPGGGFTSENDPRLTPLGGLLRKTKVNELPQLWNVLIGEMSVIGPRPLPQASFELYAPEVQAALYHARPGLSGIASLIFRDEERLLAGSGQDPASFYRDVILPYKGELELWYQKHKAVKTDFLIFFLTAWSVLRPHSTVAFRWLQDLPQRPAQLRRPRNQQ